MGGGEVYVHAGAVDGRHARFVNGDHFQRLRLASGSDDAQLISQVRTQLFSHARAERNSVGSNGQGSPAAFGDVALHGGAAVLL